jgi:hypothetical protein
MIDENEYSDYESIDSMPAPGSISRVMANADKAQSRPLIDHLPDAIKKDELGRPILLAVAGDKLVIERFATILSHKPWLDTKTYTVESVDEATGVVTLWDEDLYRNSTTNYITGAKAGYRFKLATAKGAAIGSKRRGRPRKNPVPVEPKPVVLGPDGQPVKKKRGRPAGAKNRDRSVIVAEKAAKMEKRKIHKTKKS